MLMIHILILFLILTISGWKTIQAAEAKKKLHFGMMSSSSSFFEPVKAGWEATCDQLGVTCEYHANNYTHFFANHPTYDFAASGKGENWTNFKEDNPSEDNKHCQTIMRQFIAQKVDGMAVKCNNDHPVFQEAKDAGIPVVTFDGPHQGVHDVYVGTNQTHLGKTMARLLRLLKPEGGTYVLGWNGGSPTAGTQWDVNTIPGQLNLGFKEEIEKDNGRSDRAHWNEADLNFTYTGLGTTAEKRIANMQKLADHNPTAMIFTYQTPMRHENYTDFVDRNRFRNITYIGTDGNDYQLAYMARKYVNGLVGQLTYDMGAFSAETLYKIVTEGVESFEETVIGTQLISYSLVPSELPALHIEQSLLGNLKYTGFTCFAAVAASALVCMIWTVYHRNGMVVRASQPIFLIMTTGGILIMSGALIPLSFDDKGEAIDEARAVGICMSIPWLAFIGFTVTFSALFAKTWRVNKFFHSKSSYGRIQVSEKDVSAPFAILLALNIIVLTCWTIIDPITYVREFEDGTDSYNREIESTGSCRSAHAFTYLIPLGLINFSLLVTACWQAFEARDIKSEFAEAKYIGLAVFSMSQAFLTGIPILAVVSDIPEAFYLVLTFFIFILCMVVLLLIFMPKIIMQRSYSRMSARQQKQAMAVSVRRSSGHQLASSRSGFMTGNSGSFRTTITPSSCFSPPALTPKQEQHNNSYYTKEDERGKKEQPQGVTTGVKEVLDTVGPLHPVHEEEKAVSQSQGAVTARKQFELSAVYFGSLVERIDDAGPADKHSSYISEEVVDA